MSYTSIIDRPRLKNEKDLFGITKYQEALVSFIRQTDTPITIAIQGEWGSGKTSLMNILKAELCEEANAPFFGIWLNTWQYSLMRSPEETLIRIIGGLTRDILKIVQANTESSKTADITQKIGKGLGMLFKSAAKISANLVSNQLGIENASDIVDNLLGANKQEEQEEAILTVRNGLEEAIQKCLDLDKTGKKGFIFFVDDLDRIDPPVAVQILELLKNIFDIKNCVFVLAIDYDVVIKGLKPKFGELTTQNEREFRSFFDKIIQLPFSMPVGTYQVNEFIADSVNTIGLLDPKEKTDPTVIADISEMAEFSVGTNPRSLKRLMNTLSLIQIINQTTGEKASQQTWEKLVNFGLVCLQVAYPRIYNILTNFPDFSKWNAEVLTQYKIAEMDEATKESLKNNEMFDEEWEQILYQICQADYYLSSRVYWISNLLNKIRTLVPDREEESFGDTIERILTLSAVTNVTTNEKPKKERKDKTGRDISKFIYKGTEYGKGRCVLAVIRDYVSQHPDITYSELEQVFPQSLQGRETFTTLEIAQSKPSTRNFIKPEDVIQLKDAVIAVSSQWGIDNFSRFMEHCRGMGIVIS